jgi:hypothetical protein
VFGNVLIFDILCCACSLPTFHGPLGFIANIWSPFSYAPPNNCLTLFPKLYVDKPLFASNDLQIAINLDLDEDTRIWTSLEVFLSSRIDIWLIIIQSDSYHTILDSILAMFLDLW